jgi:hypothetical protein
MVELYLQFSIRLNGVAHRDNLTHFTISISFGVIMQLDILLLHIFGHDDRPEYGVERRLFG